MNGRDVCAPSSVRYDQIVPERNNSVAWWLREKCSTSGSIMETQLMFSDLMAAAAVVASSAAVCPTTTSTLSNGNNSVHLDSSQSAAAFYSGSGSNPANGQTNNTKGNYLEDQRALQLAFELSMLNNNNSNGGVNAPDAAANGNGSNASSLSSSSSMGQHSNGNGGDMNPAAFYLNHHQQQQRQQGSATGGNDYENVLQHFLGSGSHEPVLNNHGSSGQHYHHQQQHQQQQQQQQQLHQQFDDMTLEKFLLNQNGSGSNGGVSEGNSSNEYFNHQQRSNGHQHLNQNHHNSNTLNNLINGISSINLSSNSGHGYPNGGQGGGGGGNGGLLNETERFKKSQNMTECVPVPSSEHVAEIVGRQGCKIKALRAKTNTYIKTPVRGEEPVFVVTGRKEDVAKAKKEILSAAEHFSLIRASRKPSLTNGSSGGGGSIAGLNSMAGSPLLAVSSGNNGLGDIFSSSSSGDDSPSILTKNPIGLNSAAAAAAAAGHNQITVQVRVPYRVVGLVVGPKGATIKNIQQQTHTYIVTPSRDKEPIFEVTGAVENVEIARQQIEAHIAMRTGGNSESTDNLTNYLNSINSRSGMDLAMKKELQDELQLLNENFGQSTNFLRKYLNGSGDGQAQDGYGNASYGDVKQQQEQQQSANNLAAMELLMSQLYNQDNQVVGGGLNEVEIPSSVDLFGNRIRIDELLQTKMQQKQQQQMGHSNGEGKRDVDHLLMTRNLYSSDFPVNAALATNSQPMANNYYGNFSDSDSLQQHKMGQYRNAGGNGAGGDDQGLLRRQLLSNNSEDDEGVGLELQEASPPNTSTNIMKLIMDGTEENKKYLWSTLSAAVAGTTSAAAPGNGKCGMGNGKSGSEIRGANHSSDSSCLSSASPSPTLSKFFTFQNGGGGGGNGGSGSKERKDRTEVELAAQMM